FGDFYKLWLETKLSIKSMESTHSKNLVEHLENREKNLTENKIVLSAIYLDPRIRRVLIKNPIQLVCAKNHLAALMRKILALNKKVIAYCKIASESQSSSLSEIDGASQSSLLKDFLSSIEVNSENEESDDDDDPELKLAMTEIHTYSPKQIGLQENIMEYWEGKKFTYPRLYQLAKVLHSVPATQVSV
ncbi:hypothetical protein KR074_009043, partial [Drosophila pseudoananassae]